jgi:hypothetical protein
VISLFFTSLLLGIVGPSYSSSVALKGKRRSVLFWLFCPILGAALFPVLNTDRIEGTTDDMVSHSGKIFDSSSPNQDDGVLLEIMTNAWDIGRNFDAVGESHTSYFPQG